MAVAVIERDRLRELAETDKIRELRKQYRRENEMSYAADKDILSFALTLSGISDQKIYVGKAAAIYFEILDTKNFLLEKFAELTDIETIKYKGEIELCLKEADEKLDFIRNEFL